jgi:hypothetical protein
MEPSESLDWHSGLAFGRGWIGYVAADGTSAVRRTDTDGCRGRQGSHALQTSAQGNALSGRVGVEHDGRHGGRDQDADEDRQLEVTQMPAL